MQEIGIALGTVLIACVGASGLFIAGNKLHWCAYGRQTLALFGAWQFHFVFIRLLVQFDVITHGTTVLLSGVGAGVFLAALVNLIGLHVLWHRYGLAAMEGASA